MLPGITDRDVVRFMCGDCMYLARAVNRRTGWPMHAFLNGLAEPDLHVFVVMPDGRALDVNGPVPLEDMLDEWRVDHGATGHVPLTWEDMRDMEWAHPHRGHYTYRRAHIVAGRLLDHINAEESIYVR